MKARRGFSLLELVVALSVLSVGVLGLSAAAVVAHRAFVTADAVQRASYLAAAIVDSLAQAPRVMTGERIDAHTRAQWTVSPRAPGIAAVHVSVQVMAGGAPYVANFHTWHGNAATR
jgi:prepilin-type N-terminal cleavage/methylation domain-containing protein